MDQHGPQVKEMHMELTCEFGDGLDLASMTPAERAEFDAVCEDRVRDAVAYQMSNETDDLPY